MKSILLFLLLLPSCFLFSSNQPSYKNIPISTDASKNGPNLQYLCIKSLKNHMQTMVNTIKLETSRVKHYQIKGHNEKYIQKNIDIIKNLIQSHTDVWKKLQTTLSDIKFFPIPSIQSPIAIIEHSDIVDKVLEDNNTTCLQILLDYGCNLYVCDENFNTHFHTIAEYNGIECLQLITKNYNRDNIARAALNLINKENMAPIHIALKKHDHTQTIADLFLELGTDPYIANKDYDSLLHFTMDNRPSYTYKLFDTFYKNSKFIQPDYRIEKKNNRTYAHLIAEYACTITDLEKILPHLQPIINIPDCYGCTPVHHLISSINKHQTSHDKNFYGDTIITHFINHTNPDLNIIYDIWTALHFFVLFSNGFNDKKAIFQKFLDHGARIENIAKYLVQQNKPDLIECLIPIDINEQDQDKSAALHHAIKDNKISLAKKLISYGACLEIKNYGNQTPLDYLNGQEYPNNPEGITSENEESFYDNETMRKELESLREQYLKTTQQKKQAEEDLFQNKKRKFEK